MRIAIVFVLLLLSLPAAARPPQEVVRQVYDFHKKSEDMKKTVVSNRDCFSPGFYDLALKVLSKPQTGPLKDDDLDFDFFFDSQDGGWDYELGKVSQSGKEAVVVVNLFQRGDYRNPHPDPDWKKKRTFFPAQIYLIDGGRGFQITDIHHLPRDKGGSTLKVKDILGKAAVAK